MSQIFLSYSSADHEAAIQFCALLKDHGYHSVFAFEDPAVRKAGEPFESEIIKHLRSCNVLVALNSAHYRASEWCHKELTCATTEKLPIIPVTIDEERLHPLLARLQAAPFNDGQGTHVIEPVIEALNRKGVFPRFAPWDPKQSPFPGLPHFEEDEEPIFFGRANEIKAATKLLGDHTRRGWLLVVGESGSGKSSFVRAGLLPHLRRDAARWVIGAVATIPPAGKSPLDALAHAFFERWHEPLGWTQWKQVRKLMLQGLRDQSKLQDLGIRLRLSAGSINARVVLVVDQLEELLRGGNADVRTRERRALEKDKQDCLQLLRCLSDLSDTPFLVLGTLRSDFQHELTRHPKLTGLDLAESTFTLPPMTPEQLRIVIEDPLRLVNVTFDKGLAECIIGDMKGDDPLPLLAFTLRQLFDEHAGDADLTIGEYAHDLGGLKGIIQRTSDRLLKSLKPSQDPSHPDAKELRPLCAAFLAMARPEEAKDRYTRRRVRVADLSRDVVPWLSVFERARLVVRRGAEPHCELELAHDALFRHWGLLRQWLHEHEDLLAFCRRLDVYRQSGDLLSGRVLADARRWLASDGDLLTQAEAAYIKTSVRKLQIWKFASAVVVLFVLAGVGTVAVRYIQYESAMNDGRLRLAAQTLDEPTERVAFLREVSRDVPQERISEKLHLHAILMGHMVDKPILTAAFDQASTRVLTASADATACIWDLEGRPSRKCIKHDGAVSTAQFSADGHILTASWDGSARLWSDDAESFIELQTAETNAAVRSAEFSRDGQRILAVCSDGNARIWNGPSLAYVLPHEDSVLNTAKFDQRGTAVVTGSLDGTLRVWDAAQDATRSDPPNPPPSGPLSSESRVHSASEPPQLLHPKRATMRGDRDGHQRRVNTAVFTADGACIVSASDDGTARVWTHELELVPSSHPLKHEAEVSSAVFIDDGAERQHDANNPPDCCRMVLTASRDGTARIWNPCGDGSHVVLRGHKDTVRSAALCRATREPGRTCIVTVSDDGTSRIWNWRGTDPPRHAKTQRRGSNASRLPYLDGDWSVTTLRSKSATAAIASPDGKWIVTTSLDGKARVWSVDGADATAVLRGHESSVRQALFASAPDRTPVVVTGSLDGSVRVWKADGSEYQPHMVADSYRREPPVWAKPQHPVRQGPPLSADTRSSTVHGDIVTSEPSIPFGLNSYFKAVDTVDEYITDGSPGYISGVNVIAIGADGELLSAFADGTVSLKPRWWSTEPERLMRHDAPVISAVFLDGQNILTVSAADQPGARVAVQRVRLWSRVGDSLHSQLAEQRDNREESPDKSPAREAQLYRDLRAAAESGWDFSSRWFGPGGRTIADTRTTDWIPPDLNSLLYHLESTIADHCDRREARCSEVRVRADTRKRAINELLWSDKLDAYADRAWSDGTLSDRVTAATLYPLFFNVADQKRADRVAETVRKRLLGPYGISPTTEKTGLQWDAPNGWAPLQWIAIVGLKKYGHDDLAQLIAQRWVGKSLQIFHRTGKLLRQYDVVGSAEPNSADQVEDGVGWTNGVLRKLLMMYPKLAP